MGSSEATTELGCAPLAFGGEVPLSLHVSLIVFILSSEVNADIVSLYDYTYMKLHLPF